ncbi:MAG: APC family permease [Actinomycetota bacterium]|nr:APC family permease [Actinomycetota bacterium]
MATEAGQAQAGGSDERTMLSEQLAPVLLAKSLNAFDLVVIFIGIVLFITNSAGWQFVGPAAFIYLIVAYLTFFIPGAFVTAQLGNMFPEEGSIYVWTHKALGPFWGFFAGFVAWWPGPLVMVLAGTLVVTLSQSVAAIYDKAIFTKPWQQTLVILAVVFFSSAVSTLRQRVSQNYLNFQFYFYAAGLFVMGLAGVIWLAKGNPAANSFSASAWNPFHYANLTIFGFAFLALLGIEVPLNMGVEIKSPKSIRKYLFWGTVIVMVAYVWTTFANMVVVPADINNGTTGGVQAVQISLGNVMGTIVGFVLIWFFLSAAPIYNFSFARLLFVSGLEKRLPHQIGKVNRNKVPANAVYLQTALAVIIAILFFYILPTAGTDANAPYFALLASVNVIWGLSMILLFSDVFFVKTLFRERYDNARTVPSGFLQACGVIGLLASVGAIYTTFVAAWYPKSDSTPSGFTSSGWRLWLAIITIASILIGVVIYFISERVKHETVAVGTAPPAVAGGSG